MDFLAAFFLFVGAFLLLSHIRFPPVCGPCVHPDKLDTTTLPPSIGPGQTSPITLRAVRLRGKGVWAMDVPAGMTRLRATPQVPSHLRHLAGGTLLVVVDGTPAQMIDLDTPPYDSIDVLIEGAQEVRFERTVGESGEVGATIDLVDGVMTGPLH